MRALRATPPPCRPTPLPVPHPGKGQSPTLHHLQASGHSCCGEETTLEPPETTKAREGATSEA